MGPEDAQPARSRMKKKRMHYPSSPWHHDAPEDARMGPKNPSETLKSLGEVQATLEAQLEAIKLAIDHFKTKVT